MQQGAFAIANAQILRRTRQPTTAQSRHPPGKRHAENLLLICIKKIQYLLNCSSDFRSICIRSLEKMCLTKRDP